MFHCIGHNTLFDDLLGCRTQDCAAPSVCHWSTKRQSHLGRKSRAPCQRSGAGGAAGQGGRRQTWASLSHLSTSAGDSALPAQQYLLGASTDLAVQDQAGGARGHPLNSSAVPWWIGALTRQSEMWLGWSLPASDCELLVSMAVSILSSAIKKKKKN